MQLEKRGSAAPKVAACAALVIALFSIGIGPAAAASSAASVAYVIHRANDDKRAQTASQDVHASDGRKSPTGLEFSRR